MTTATLQFENTRQAKVVVSNAQGTFVFRAEEITRLQACSNYTFIHFINRKPMLISKVLKNYETLLSPMGFLRTHQSHLVNTRYIRHMDRQGCIELLDSTKVEVSRSKRKLVLATLRSFAQPSSAPDYHFGMVASA